MKLFVSYSHRLGFGNATLDNEDDITPKDQDDVRELQRLINDELGADNPIILWWTVLDEVVKEDGE